MAVGVAGDGHTCVMFGVETGGGGGDEVWPLLLPQHHATWAPCFALKAADAGAAHDGW